MKAIVTVNHSWYGCETGCCGHNVHIRAPDSVPDDVLPKSSKGQAVRSDSQFYFEHPWEANEQEFADELVRMTVDHRGFASDIIKACGGYEVESMEISND